MKRNTTTLLALTMGLQLFATPFQNIRFDQNINTQSLETTEKVLSMTNDTAILGVTSEEMNSTAKLRASEVNGVTIDIYEDGKLKLYFTDPLEGTDPLDKILVNDIPLLKAIEDRIVGRGNPLWGKKLAILGDSLTVVPGIPKSYGACIAERNNMELFNMGRGGKALCIDKEDNPALIRCYTNGIPKDVDFILCQIGTNDASEWWARDEDASTPVEDTDMTTNTFKGCFNNLLLGLKKTYPNAKVGIILPNNWGYNVGSNSTDVIRTPRIASLANWEKAQCHRLNMPVFDPVEDTRWFVWNRHQYTNVENLSDVQLTWFDQMKQEMGTLQIWRHPSSGLWMSQSQYLYDTIHTTEKGSLLLSFFYENWMKTVLMAN